ncbi:DUF6768 family protein [Rhizobium sp. L1K21]|uniref:DUF6768 family protein n=1 Tax=Rhizobium sp. L1K21 TaxID=2954933 RepID=UPI002093C9BE|nr:DUF6768 family protein [Rhizobium sp. L1K21]MCO6187010.1 hypothetical protein [Rhizobium sp. L1K21]
MSKIDDMIREALRCEDRAAMRDDDGEPSFFALSRSQFHGVNGWIAWVIMIFQFIFSVLGVYCLVRMFLASEVLAALKWGISGSTALILGLQIKLSLMPQIQADRVIREIRRLELRLSSTEK